MIYESIWKNITQSDR